jgi:hypothetical protein
MTTFAFLFRSAGIASAAIAWMIGSPTVMAEMPLVVNEHSLDPAIRQAESSLDEIKRIKDYQTTMVKRERVGGKLGEYEYAYIRVRHEPFSVYMYLLAPANIRGCQVMYVEGRNDGKMLIRSIGCGVTLAIKPDSPLAMTETRYPISTIGIENLAAAFAKRARRDKELPAECDVRFFDGTKVNRRSTTMIQVTHN